ncbi:helix-turn-helix domain-containing protein [Streptomyces virginiae]
MPAPPMLTTAEAAQTLGVSTRTVCRYVEAGKLSAGRNSNGGLRFDSADVLAAQRTGLGRPAPVPVTCGPDAAEEVPAAAAPVTGGQALPEWLLVHEAAALLRMSERAVREQAAREEIPARRYGGRWRIHRSAVEAPEAP